MGAPLDPLVLFGQAPALPRRSLRERLRAAISAWTGIGGGHQTLYVTADALVCLRQSGRRWQPIATFRLGSVVDTERGAESTVAASPVPEAFRDWITRSRGDTISFLLDSADEEIEIDELPNVRGRDRDKVLDRRLKQRFRDAALTTWIVSQSGAGKKDAKSPATRECTLLVGLRQRNPMMLWIESALAAGARIVAVDSLALRTAQLLRSHGKAGTALLASVQPGGLRQSLVHKGEVCFTRLQPLELGAPWARVAEELDRTVRFLMMSRAYLRPLIQAGTVPIVVIGAGIDSQSAGAHEAQALPLREAAVPITWLDGPDAAGGEAHAPLGGLHFFLAPQHGHRANYAPPDMRANWRTARSLAAGWSFATIALLLALGANLFIQYTLSGRMDAVGARPRMAAVEGVREQARRIEQRLGTQAISAEQMDAVVQLATQLRSRQVDAAQTLRWIGQGLARETALSLDEIAWEPAQPLGGAGAPPTVGAPAIAPVPQPLAPEPGAINPAGPLASATTPTVIRISGTVDPATSKELANNKVAELFARLKAGCGCMGRIVVLPYDPSMDVAFAASLRDSNRPAAPHFTLELQRPAPAVFDPATTAEPATGLSQTDNKRHG